MDRSTTLSSISVDLDAAAVEEAGESVPAAQYVADRFGRFALAADGRELSAQPGLERVDDRAALLLTNGAVGLGKPAR